MKCCFADNISCILEIFRYVNQRRHLHGLSLDVFIVNTRYLNTVPALLQWSLSRFISVRWWSTKKILKETFDDCWEVMFSGQMLFWTSNDQCQSKLISAGMCSRTAWSRPRPGVFEAKAKAKNFCPRGRGQSLRTPIPGLFTARCYAASGYATSSLCPSLSNSTPYCRLLCATALVYEVLYLWY